MSDEAEISRTLANIHAVARHLLGVTELARAAAPSLFVSVSPSGRMWVVTVSFEGFKQVATSPVLAEALEMMLRQLMTSVSRRFEEDTRLLALMKEPTGNKFTADHVRDVVLGVPGVDAVEMEDTMEPGVVNVVVHSRSAVGDAWRQMVFDVGFVLGKAAPASVRFKIYVDP